MKLVERGVAGILLTIAVGMALHTPLTLWLGTQWPSADLVIKAWKEILMGIALVLLIAAVVKQGRLQGFLADRLLQLSLVFAGLHFIMMTVFQNGLDVAGAGLLIDLRFVLYFVLTYVFVTVFPAYRRRFVAAFGIGAAIVIGFAFLQVTVLPKDVLSVLGYSKETISPYLTVDENPDYVRINSTMRGPNPLGAFVVIVVGLVTALVCRWKLNGQGLAFVTAAAAASAVTLVATYSRSSLIAAIVTVLLVLVIVVSTRTRKRIAAAVVVAAIIATAGLFALRDTAFVANVILHDSPTTGAHIDSNSGHAESLADGTARMARQPFGAGVGSTGSASLIGDKPLIIENQYLFVAHEVGWAGLAVFVWLFVEVLRRLWRRRRSALALGVLSSGVGLAVIGLLLPVWTDDTVSIMWWGLAAVAVATQVPGPVARKTLTPKKAKKRHGA